MTNKKDNQIKWSDSDTKAFLKYGEVFTPDRDELKEILLSVMPADKQEDFTAFDIGVGGGWISELILKNFPNANVMALDGSLNMIHYTKQAQQKYSDRIEFKQFDLIEKHWRNDLKGKIKCILSSLVIHHINGKEKKQLYKDLYEALDSNGALIIFDVVKAESNFANNHAGEKWNQITKERSFNLLGDLSAYNYFVQEAWNIFQHPNEDIDKPSSLYDQLTWLKEAGFKEVDVLWAKAGHVMFAGFK
uniref:class I SAM-dependent methyltransferase n=1 Tax=Bacillaceae bacterium JMAK1 TaxID=1028381 RepID=UPI0003AC4344|nr:class I SAM-dependent methyltransferase [Bacillaceae bacterium JMAK1]AGQ45436.1 methyltransferase domain protein [Bacillaceae bacterium JMAK1]